MTELYIGLILTVAGILLSALYSGLETGLYTINKVRLDVRATSGVASAKRLLALVNKPTRMLAVLLVCNNIANFLASYGTARMLAATDLGTWSSIAVNALIMIPILFIFGEVLPKDLFRTHTDTWTYRWSGSLSVTDTLLWWTGVVPFVATAGTISRKLLGSESTFEPSPRRRFGLLFKEGLGGGVLSDEQITLADRVLAMQSLTVKSEMIPWHRVTSMSIDMPISKRNLALKHIRHTRIPVTDHKGRVLGVLPILSALLEPESTTSSLLTKPFHIPSDMLVGDALQKLRKSGISMAIITNQQEKPLGIVTLKDLVEPIVGELNAW